MNRKAQIGIYISFMILVIIIILITAVFAPMGVLFNAKMYEAGEGILIDANASIQNINDSVVRGQITNATNAALAASQNNIEVNASLFQYGWVLVILLTALVLFLFTRRLVEFGGGGLV